MFDGLHPFLMMSYEGIIFHGVTGPFEVHILQRMGRELVIDDVLRRDPQEACLGHTEELIEVSGISRTDLESAVDIGDSVRVAIDKYIDRDFLEIRQAPDEAAAGARGHTAHAHQDAAGFFPVDVLHQALKHAGGFNDEDEGGAGFKLKVLHRNGDAVGAGAELGAIDPKHLSRIAVVIDHDQPSRYVTPFFLRYETQLLAIDRKERLHIVHHGV